MIARGNIVSNNLLDRMISEDWLHSLTSKFNYSACLVYKESKGLSVLIQDELKHLFFFSFVILYFILFYFKIVI